MNIEEHKQELTVACDMPTVSGDEDREGERAYCVYMHRNKINGKVYVGMTNDVERRWRYGGCEYRRSHSDERHAIDSNSHPPFWNAIEKYGWDAFEHIIIRDELTFEEAENEEIKWIAHYKSNCVRYKNPSYGYNLTDGGRGSRGRPLTEKEKHHLSDKNSGAGNPRYGAQVTAETRAKIAQGVRARAQQRSAPSPLKGRKLSEEARQSLIGRPRRRPVLCVETGEVFATAKHAGNHLGVSGETVRRAARMKYPLMNGYSVRFVDELSSIDASIEATNYIQQ